MSFAALPPVPTSGLTEAEFQLLSAISQNISQLTGQTGTTYRALVAGQISTEYAPDGTATGVAISGSLGDIVPLAASLQALISDVQALRDTLNTLIAQLQS